MFTVLITPAVTKEEEKGLKMEVTCASLAQTPITGTVKLTCMADCISVEHGQFLLFTSFLLLLTEMRPSRHEQLRPSAFTSPSMKPHMYLLPQQVP